MLKTEAKLATHLRRALGRSARVAIGPMDSSKPEKAYSKPWVYIRLSQFCDLTEKQTNSVHTNRTLIADAKLHGFIEQRPGNIMIHADILSDDYLEIQELRQIIVGEVLVFAEGIKSMTLSKPKDGNVLLEFKDLVTTLNRFAIDPVNLRGMSIFCGQIQFQLNGFLHVCVKRVR